MSFKESAQLQTLYEWAKGVIPNPSKNVLALPSSLQIEPPPNNQNSIRVTQSEPGKLLANGIELSESAVKGNILRLWKPQINKLSRAVGNAFAPVLAFLFCQFGAFSQQALHIEGKPVDTVFVQCTTSETQSFASVFPPMPKENFNLVFDAAQKVFTFGVKDAPAAVVDFFVWNHKTRQRLGVGFYRVYTDKIDGLNAISVGILEADKHLAIPGQINFYFKILYPK